MNNKKWNINILLCGECDENIANISNIFDKLSLNEENRASFDIVTIMSAIGCDENQFALLYVVEKLEKERTQIAFIGSTIHRRIEEKEVPESLRHQSMLKCSMEGTTFKTNRIKVRNSYFPGIGNYEMKVFKCDKETEIEKIQHDDNHYWSEFADEEHLVTTYPFIVGRKGKFE